MKLLVEEIHQAFENVKRSAPKGAIAKSYAGEIIEFIDNDAT